MIKFRKLIRKKKPKIESIQIYDHGGESVMVTIFFLYGKRRIQVPMPRKLLQTKFADMEDLKKELRRLMEKVDG